MSLIKIPVAKEVKKFLIIFYIVALPGFVIPFTRNIFIMMIPLALCINIFLLINFHQKWNVTFIILSVFVFLSGFLIEAAGVNTGFPFGNYIYGKALVPKLFGTPLIIGLNWLMLVYCTYVIIEKIKIHMLLKTIIGGSIMVLYDVILEPVAISLDMWQWPGNSAPLSNYISWFIVSFVFIFMFQIFHVKIRNEIAIPVFILQLAFFLILFVFTLFYELT